MEQEEISKHAIKQTINITSPFVAELLIEEDLKIDLHDLLERLNTNGRIFFGFENNDGFTIGVYGYKVELKEGVFHPGYIITPIIKPLDIDEYDSNDLSIINHTKFLWPEVKEIIKIAIGKIIISDLLFNYLDYKIRFNLFREVLLSITGLIPCLAIHWKGSQKLTNPYFEKIISPSTKKQRLNLLDLAVNVRMFKKEKNGDIIMDTVGLSNFGLPDLQCHYKNLPPKDIAQILYSSAEYIYLNGDVIKDGDTIQGISENDHWICQHEIAIVNPNRIVLDINPGTEFSSRER
ncbi:MAG: DUF4261 domain-containing protein [Candidatus Lokiarchaeota archaeon]|nr:DUF4261 domain-containing protein [Candidatus Lokiarchaeota archaeon]